MIYLKKIIPLLVCLLLALSLFAGCIGQGTDTTTKSSDTRTIVDMAGKTVTIPKNIERVAIFGGPIGQVPYILGVEDKLCAVSKGHQRSELLATMDPRIMTLPAPRSTNGVINIEELLSSNPQFVIAGDVDAEIVEKNTKITVVQFMATSDGNYAQTKAEVNFLGEVFERPEKAKKYCDYLDNTIKFLNERLADLPEDERLVVFNGFDSSHLVTYGTGSYMEERIESAGCLNAASDVSTQGKKEGIHSGLDQISMEQLIAWNPDIIIIDFGTPEDLYNDPRWAKISAIKNKKVYRLPSAVFIWNRPSAESAVLHPIWLAKIAHPDRFKDVDIRAEIKKFYKEIFEYDLTEQQVDKILSGEYASTVGGLSGGYTGGQQGGGQGQQKKEGNQTKQN